MWHDDWALHSATAYQTHLHRLAAQASPAQQGVIQNILALYARAGVGPLVGFSANDLTATGLTVPEKESLINPWSLGYGRPYGGVRSGIYRPGLIIVGTAQAYDVADLTPRAVTQSASSATYTPGLTCAAVEAIGLSALWLRTPGALPAPASPLAHQVVSEVVNLSAVTGWAQPAFHQHLPFHLDPSHCFGPLAARHTWRKAALAVRGSSAPAAVSDLFRRAYLIEMGAYPASRAANERSPDPQRLQFLAGFLRAAGLPVPVGGAAGVVPACELPVGTVMFHGKGSPAVQAGRAQLIRAFLGPGTPTRSGPIVVGKRSFEVQDLNNKRAIETVALSGRSGASNAYWEVVREQLAPRTF